jgi:hypothetical protein
MALASTRAQDYYILRDGSNVVPGVPKSSWTPAKGHLCFRTNNQSDEWDLAVAGSNPAGIVENVNNNNGTITVAMLNAGSGLALILQHDQSGGPALGDKVQTTATALGSTIGRTVVTTNAGGVGRITALTPRGANTVEVTF